MSALWGAITTLVADPATAGLIGLLALYLRRIETHIRRDVQQVRDRVKRVEDQHLATDGGDGDCDE